MPKLPITRTTFLLSVLGHSALLLIPRLNNSSDVAGLKPATTTVIMVMPEIEPLLEPPAPFEQPVVKQPPVEQPTVEQPTIEQPTTEQPAVKQPVVEQPLPEQPAHSKAAIINYQHAVRQKIENSKMYPAIARRRGIEGKVFVNFTIGQNGFTDDIKIVSSSGFEILDKEAIAAVKRANPFPPIPGELSCSSLNIKVAIVFSLV